MQPILLLRVLIGAQELEQRPFALDRIVLGRDPYSHIYLEDPQVSREHAWIDHAEGQYTIRDCGSSNGTRVNGTRVEEAVLGHGDCIALGRFRIQVEIHQPSEPDHEGANRDIVRELGDHTMRSDDLAIDESTARIDEQAQLEGSKIRRRS